MNNNLFDFQHRPFAATPDVDNYVPNESIESSIDSVSQCIQRAAGPAMVIGPAGIGKSMLCVELANRLQQNYEIVLLATSRLCTRRALLQNILFELGLHFRDREEGELRLGILEHLKSAQATSRGMLLIVDEAQTMPLRLLEEIRGLTNIHRQGESRVHLVLAGTQLLDERLNHPKMEAITQRIATRCYLHPLNGEETNNYIAQQWSHAVKDGTPLPFTPSAIEAIYSATTGIPRLINQLCDHTLFLAKGHGNTRFGEELIGEAWSDLQQLPTPWQVNHRAPENEGSTTQTIVEFGTLSDEPASENQLSDDLHLTPLPAPETDHFQDVDPTSSWTNQCDADDLELAVDTEATNDLLSSLPSQPVTPTELCTEDVEISKTENSTIAALESTQKSNLKQTNGSSDSTETESELTFAPLDVANPFECDDFEEEELISEQRNPILPQKALPQDTATQFQTEEVLGFAEFEEEHETTEVAAEATSTFFESNETETLDKTPEPSHLATDFSFFLSQPPIDSLEESMDSIEDSVTESIEALAEDLAVGLGPAVHEPETSHSKTTLDGILNQLKMESAKRETLNQNSHSEDWDQELAHLEQQRKPHSDDDASEQPQDGSIYKKSQSDFVENVGAANIGTTEAIETVEQQIEGLDSTQDSTLDIESKDARTASTADDLKNPPAKSNPIIITESADVSKTDSKPSKIVSQDDRDMIVVDNPIPANPLRIIGAQDQEDTQGHPAPESVAFREDYQKLMRRLRGSMKS